MNTAIQNIIKNDKEFFVKSEKTNKKLIDMIEKQIKKDEEFRGRTAEELIEAVRKEKQKLQNG